MVKIVVYIVAYRKRFCKGFGKTRINLIVALHLQDVERYSRKIKHIELLVLTPEMAVYVLRLSLFSAITSPPFDAFIIPF